MTAPSDPQARDRIHLAEAIALGRQGMRQRAGGPFGAVVVATAEDTVIARGWNRVTSTADPTAHAEMEAIRRAGSALGTFELVGTTIYASGEPCPMCWAACRWARIDRIVYASPREEAAAIGFDDQFLYDELARDRDDQAVPLAQVPMQAGLDLYAEWAADDSYTRY